MFTSSLEAPLNSTLSALLTPERNTFRARALLRTRPSVDGQAESCAFTRGQNYHFERHSACFFFLFTFASKLIPCWNASSLCSGILKSCPSSTRLYFVFPGISDVGLTPQERSEWKRSTETGPRWLTNGNPRGPEGNSFGSVYRVVLIAAKRSDVAARQMLQKPSATRGRTTKTPHAREQKLRHGTTDVFSRLFLRRMRGREVASAPPPAPDSPPAARGAVIGGVRGNRLFPLEGRRTAAAWRRDSESGIRPSRSGILDAYSRTHTRKQPQEK